MANNERYNYMVGTTILINDKRFFELVTFFFSLFKRSQHNRQFLHVYRRYTTLVGCGF